MGAVSENSDLFPFGGSFSIDGISSDTWSMYYSNWEISIVPTVRANLVPVPGRTGKSNAGVEYDSRVVRMTITCLSPDRQQLHDYLRAFTAAIDPRAGGHRLILMDDDDQHYINVLPTSEVPVQPSLIIGTFDVQFEAPDPHWYFYIPRSLAWTPTSNGATTVLPNSNGNDSTPPVWTIRKRVGSAALSNIVLSYGGSTLTYTGSILDGDVVVIDCDHWTINKNGVPDINHWGGDDFPMVQPGGGVVSWHDANAAGAQISVAYTERSI